MRDGSLFIQTVFKYQWTLLFYEFRAIMAAWHRGWWAAEALASNQKKKDTSCILEVQEMQFSAQAEN